MFNRCRAFCLALACCSVGYADPFAPAMPAQDAVESPAPVPGYRVLGVVVSKSRQVAAIRTADAGVRVVRPGERVGDATVSRITPDSVSLDAGGVVVHLPMVDR